MRNAIRRFYVAAAAASALSALAACNSDSTSPTVAASNPLLAKGGSGGGGGGGAGVIAALPTISISSPQFPGQPVPVGHTVTFFVQATSEPGDRNPPAVALVTVPPGFTLISQTVMDSPHGGGPGYVLASYSWTPTREQIGFAATVTVSATTVAGTSASSFAFGPVVDAPEALTGLVATTSSDHIAVSWNPSADGAAPVQYSVQACYRNANIRPSVSTCDNVATTSAPSIDLPLFNANPTTAPAGGVATYFFVIVTPTDALGRSGNPGMATVQ